jgi:hypothetical protein
MTRLIAKKFCRRYSLVRSLWNQLKSKIITDYDQCDGVTISYQYAIDSSDDDDFNVDNEIDNEITEEEDFDQNFKSRGLHRWKLQQKHISPRFISHLTTRRT